MKVTFMGAGSSAFVKNVFGDCMLTDSLHDMEIALYDIDGTRLDESFELMNYLNHNINEDRATIKKYLGVEQRKDALRGASFVVNAIQVGRYDPCTIIDFEIPKKYGLRQTVADTLGIGGIMRGLRTIPVLDDFAHDVEEVCPDAWFLNYSNPMAILTGYMQRFTGMKTIGLCHSVQVCSSRLLEALGIKVNGFKDYIAGINHMAWLLKITDLDGNDLYPLIREKATETLERHLKNGGWHNDLVRYEYIRRFGYYCTESSPHNAEYNNLFIKDAYPEIIKKYHIPIDQYLETCRFLIDRWDKQKAELFNGGNVTHEKSNEYASHIIEAIAFNKPYEIGGNVINNGCITNLPHNACVEVPCLVNGAGIHPTHVGDLPEQLAAMNRTNINAQLLTIQAAVSKKREDVYMAAMLDPHTSAELSIDDIIDMCDELIDAHQEAGYMTQFGSK